jgi:hypothetical protein
MIFSLISYQYVPKLKQQPKNDLVVDLVHKSFDDEFFLDSDYYYSSIKLGNFKKRKHYLQYLKENYKGIPQNDSIEFQRCLDDRFFI